MKRNGPIMNHHIEEGKQNQGAKPPTNMSKTDQRNETKWVQKEWKNFEKSSKMDFSQLCSPKRPNMWREIEHKYQHNRYTAHDFSKIFYFLFFIRWMVSMPSGHSLYFSSVPLFCVLCAGYWVCIHITIDHVSFLSTCIFVFRMLDIESICKLCVRYPLFIHLGIDEIWYMVNYRLELLYFICRHLLEYSSLLSLTKCNPIDFNRIPKQVFLFIW